MATFSKASVAFTDYVSTSLFLRTYPGYIAYNKLRFNLAQYKACFLRLKAFNFLILKF